MSEQLLENQDELITEIFQTPKSKSKTKYTALFSFSLLFILGIFGVWITYQTKSINSTNQISMASSGEAVLQATAPSTCEGIFQHVSLPLNELTGPYLRMDGQSFTIVPGTSFEIGGGLYKNGQNTRPTAHNSKGVELGNSVVPLDANGNPSASGKIGLISVGMSNTSSEFTEFARLALEDSTLNQNLVIVNGAQGGQTSVAWTNPTAPTWNELDARLASAGITPEQVQIAWVKQAQSGSGNFPTKALALEEDLELIVQNLKTKYPNIKQAFISSRTRSYRYWEGLSPEPTAFETGFSVKWLIQSQIEGDPTLNYDPNVGVVKAPWLSWGPYFWVNESPRQDGTSWTQQDLAQDCIHPSASGRTNVGQQLLNFFKNDETTKMWFVGGSSGGGTTPPPPSDETFGFWNTQWCNPTEPRVEKQSFYSNIMDTWVGYTIYKPEGYDNPSNTTKYPVIYFLHGVNGQECNYLSTTENNASNLINLVERGVIPPTILVFPNGGKGLGYVDSPGDCATTKECPESMLINELIPHIDSTYRTVANRFGRGLQGFSMGGQGTMRLGLKHNDLFCSIAPLSPAFTSNWPEIQEYINSDSADIAQSMIFKMSAGSVEGLGSEETINTLNDYLAVAGVPEASRELSLGAGVGHNLNGLLGVADSEAPGLTIGERLGQFHWSCFNNNGGGTTPPPPPPPVENEIQAVISVAPTSGSAPLDITASASSSSSPNGNIVSYNWDFGDGTTGQAVNINHTYETPGTYTLSLTIADSTGETATDQTTINVTESDNDDGDPRECRDYEDDNIVRRTVRGVQNLVDRVLGRRPRNPQPCDDTTPPPPVDDEGDGGDTAPPPPGIGNGTPPYAEAPSCEELGIEHDSRKWHGIWNPAEGCHWDHEHKQDPHDMDDVFGTEVYNWFGSDVGKPVDISYPWQTFAGAGANFESYIPGTTTENSAKHEGNHWLYVKDRDASTGSLLLGSNTITDARVHYHQIGGQLGAFTRFHSTYAQIRACDSDNVDPASQGVVTDNCGTYSGGGWVDFGRLNFPNRGTYAPLPGDPPEFANSPAELAPYRIHPIGKNSLDSWQTEGNEYNLLSSDPTGVKRLMVGFGIHFDQGESIGETDPTQALLPSTEQNPHFWCVDPETNLITCDNNNSAAALFRIWVKIYQDMDGSQYDEDGQKNGFFTFNGYTNRYGDIVEGCTQTGLDCVPVKANHFPIGNCTQDRCKAAYRGSLEADLYEADVAESLGVSWIKYPN
ncbi:MAG: PKD domain-containing protein [Patescibacteria group bacterium]